MVNHELEAAARILAAVKGLSTHRGVSANGRPARDSLEAADKLIVDVLSVAKSLGFRVNELPDSTASEKGWRLSDGHRGVKVCNINGNVTVRGAKSFSDLDFTYDRALGMLIVPGSTESPEGSAPKALAEAIRDVLSQ